MATLGDIAARVGVSSAAVSLVMNDRHKGRVSREVADQIRDAAQQLGYAPNMLARGLKTRRSHTIGLLADRVATVPFAGPMLAGAQRAAWEEEFLLLVIDTDGNRELDEPAAQALVQREVEAFIVAADFHREVVLPDRPATMPAVVLDGFPRDPATADGVVPDERGGAYVATSHLLEQGHRRIGFVTVSGDTYVAAGLRRAGYESALQAAGITPDPALVTELDDHSTAAVMARARDLLEAPDRPTAIFCFSDQIALGLSQVALSMGLRVPDDLSLMGFDNQEFVADAMLPGLTTVQLPHIAMGEWAARRAIARIRGDVDDSTVVHTVECPLVMRESVSPPPEN